MLPPSPPAHPRPPPPATANILTDTSRTVLHNVVEFKRAYIYAESDKFHDLLSNSNDFRTHVSNVFIIHLYIVECTMGK